MSLLPPSRTLLFSLLAVLGSGVASHAAPPVFDPLVPIFPTTDAPTVSRVPVGKVAVMPLSATTSNGSRLTYKILGTSKSTLRARVRTGQPKLKMEVSHAAGSGQNDPAFTGTMEFLLFRDLTPLTVGFMGGFAQAGYFDNQIFHRIVDLNPAEDADGSYILQAGDPGGTTPTLAGKGGPGFAYDNEFHRGLIFTGRGQLAMANSGANPLTSKGSNGSQFFITAGRPRFLDFNHTIFGQMIRGWDMLPKISKVETYTTQPANTDPPVGYPKTQVKYTNVTLEPDFTDAILLISPTAPGNGTIDVQITDENGETATQTIAVQGILDDTNDPPFIVPVPNQTAPLNTIYQMPLKYVDLERDYVFLSNQALSGSNGQAGGSNPALSLASSPGVINIGTSATQYDMTFRNSTLDVARGTDDQIGITVSSGDKAVTNTKILPFTAKPGVALTSVVVATFTDTDGLAQPSDYTATINWGDGSAPTTGTVARSQASPSPTAFAVSGTHTYAKPGTYTVQVKLSATKGQRVEILGMATVTDGPVRAYGRTIATKEKLINGVTATFFDDTPAAIGNYSAVISWGDGTHSNGVIRKGLAGDFQVLGSHSFPDPEDYSVVVRIHKNGTDATTDGYAWSLAQARGFVKAPHLPPYNNGNLIGQFAQNGTSALRVTLANQTYAAGQLVVINAGSITVPTSTVSFYLSADTTLNLQDETMPDPDHPGQTIITNPKDVLVTIGSKGLKTMTLPAIAPGAGRRLIFDIQTFTTQYNMPPGGENIPGMPATSTVTSKTDDRLRFPVGETGAGLNLLVHFGYQDLIAQYLPIDREVVFGPYDPFIVTPTSLVVKELGQTDSAKSFKVRLVKKPTANVTIPLTLNTTSQSQITIDKANLTFTPDNWNVDQEVLVTAKDDGSKDGTRSASVTLGAATSTDIRFNKLDPTDVSVSVVDADPVVVTPVALTIKEAGGADESKTFSVRLGIKPTANVTVPIALAAATSAQLTVDKTQLTFTADNWNTPQVVTVTAKDDGVVDGTKTVVITLPRTTSTDFNLNNVDPADVTVTVNDKATAN